MEKIILKEEQQNWILQKMRDYLYDAYRNEPIENNMIKNIETWKTNKKRLYDILSTSQYWNEDELCLELNCKVKRKIDVSLAKYMINKLMDNHQIKDNRHKYEICRAIRSIFDHIDTSCFTGFITKDIIDSIETLCKPLIVSYSTKDLIKNFDDGLFDNEERRKEFILYTLFEKHSIREGQKLCKVINKILTSEKCNIGKTDLYDLKSNEQIKGVRDYAGKDVNDWYIDYYYNYNQFFSVLSDLLSPIEYDETFYVSINPIDYLTQSHGNKWTSCHSLRNMGCYHSATLTMMNDCTTLIVYTLPDKYENHFSIRDKKTRQSLFISENNNALFQNTFYPNKDMNESDVVRRYIEMLIANYSNVENNWVLKKDTYDIDSSNYLGYCDWENGQPYYYAYLKNTDKSKTIKIGSKAYSVDKENEFVHSSESLSAYVKHCYDCEELGHVTYIEYYDSYICDRCLDENYHYCQDVEDYRHYDDCVYLEDLQGYYSCDYTYYYCDKCGCYYSMGYELQDGRWVCEDCYTKEE